MHFRIYEIEKKKLVEEVNEMHQMRFFVPSTNNFSSDSPGFEIVQMEHFPEYEEEETCR